MTHSPPLWHDLQFRNFRAAVLIQELLRPGSLLIKGFCVTGIGCEISALIRIHLEIVEHFDWGILLVVAGVGVAGAVDATPFGYPGVGGMVFVEEVCAPVARGLL